MAFTHLHVHTEYSLLDGSNKINEYVSRVKELGMDSAAITDHGVMYGVIDFYRAAKAAGINPILGCEVYVAPGSRFDREVGSGDDRYYHLVLLAENNQGYQNLMKIVSKGFVEGFYYKPRVDLELLREYHEGLIALSACLAGEVARYLQKGMYEDGKKAALRYQEIFGEGNFFLELQDHGIPQQQMVNQQLMRMHQETGIQLVATMMCITLMKQTQIPMISCFACRPARSLQIQTVCVMKADSIMLSQKKKWQHCFLMRRRLWKIHTRSRRGATWILSSATQSCPDMMCRMDIPPGNI